jgi:acyl-CoA reductase-like NAD-dependent aldehyde dehydrogenase
MPAVILKSPVILKPGREEPWTPCRIMQAFIQAGVPKEAFSFYPTNHEGSSQIMDCCKRSMIFGGQDTVERYGDNPNVEVHGPGWSKILIGDDQIEDYQDFIDLIVESVSLNSGRSCINASAVVVPKHGKKIAEALAAKLVQIKPTAIGDPHARLSSFANPKFAEFINAAIEEDLKTPGAVDCTAEARGTSNRVVIHDGRTYLLPSVIYCDSPDHPIFNKEYLFPFVTVVESEQKDFFNIIGQSLIVSGITEDESLSRELLECPLIDRLNIGPIPTTRLDWDQPHEGNLFEFLYKRRAIQRTHTER